MRLIIFAFLACLSFGSFAEEFYWLISGSSTQYPSASDACSAGGSRHNGGVFNGTFIWTGEASAWCQTRMPNGNVHGFFMINRIGTTCPPGTEYNAETGSCDEPKNECKDKAGTSEPFSKSGVAPDDFMWISADGKFSHGELYGCFSGCVAATFDKVCKTLTTGAYACRGDAEFTGEECGTGSDSSNGGPPLDPSDSSDPGPPETTTDTTPCVYSTAPDGSQTCQSSSSTNKEGLNCGTVNGVAKCIDSQPSKNNVDITTTISETSNADGTTTTTKTDKADVTSCVGIACKTTTTTTTTTTKRDAQGTVTQITGECAGPDCPDENGNPDGNGDGFGDCIGKACGGGGGGGGSYPGLEETPGFGESVTNFQQRLVASPILASVSAITVNTAGGSCSFPTADTIIGPISFDSVCAYIDLMSPLYYVFLAGWSFVAIRLFMTA